MIGTRLVTHAIRNKIVAGCAVLLLAALLGLDASMYAIQGVYEKSPIDLKQPLSNFDVNAMPSFRVVPDGGAFDLEIWEEIGTAEAARYVFEHRGYTEGDRSRDTLLFITFYNNPTDNVPHTPEVCYRQSGVTVRDMETVSIDMVGLGPIDARTLELEPPGRRAALFYVMVCNGRFYYDRNQVRNALAMPGDAYAYFSKVEVLTSVGRTEEYEDALARARLLISEALPVLVETHFPSREDVRSK